MAHKHHDRSKDEVLDSLRMKIRQGHGDRLAGRTALSLGVDGLDAALDACGFPHAATHEVAADGPGDWTAVNGFAAVILGRLVAGRQILWITREADIYPPALSGFGLQPERVTFLRARRDEDALWAMEEGLRCGGLAGVVAEIAVAGMVATRRLQLAAEQGGVPGFLLRRPEHGRGQAGLNTCATRWRIGTLPGTSLDGLPGLGDAAWEIELCRSRAGQRGVWQVRRDGMGLAPLPVQKVASDRARHILAVAG